MKLRRQKAEGRRDLTLAVLIAGILAISVESLAQTQPVPSRPPVRFNLYSEKVLYSNAADPERRLSFDVADGVLWTGVVLDVHSTLGKREAGFFRNSQGRLAVGPALATTSASWGLAKWAEYRWPEHRRAIFWIKLGAGIGRLVIAAHNYGVRGVNDE